MSYFGKFIKSTFGCSRTRENWGKRTLIQVHADTHSQYSGVGDESEEAGHLYITAENVAFPKRPGEDD